MRLFFKWIMQFIGPSRNAVKSNIGIAVSVYVLVAIVKKSLNLGALLHTLLQIFYVTLFWKIPLQQACLGSDHKGEPSNNCDQANRFAF